MSIFISSISKFLINSCKALLVCILFVSTNTLLPASFHKNRDIYREAYRYWSPTKEDLDGAKDKEYLFEGNVRVLRRVK